MLALLDRHSFIAMCLAVLLEELGVPMPIPTDLLIIFAGVKATLSLQGLGLWFLALNIASALGASGLYAVVRRGGRPLVARYGRYGHMGPEQLARAERTLARTGWTGIAIGRSIPGLRYGTVIICGLLNIPYRRFVTAHIVGSSIYIVAFLLLGAAFGPKVVERVHLPALSLRLLWLLGLGLGLPLLLAWLCYRGHAQPRVAPSRRRTLGAILLASFAGATALAASWATAASLAELLGSSRPLNVTYSLARLLLGRGLRETSAYMLVYSALLLLSVGIGAAYYELILPLLAPRGTTLTKQALGLAVLVIGLVSSFLTPALLATRGSPLDLWWRAGGPVLLLAIAAGILSYSLTTAYGRALAIAILPSLRRAAPLSTSPPPSEPAPALSPAPPAPAAPADDSATVKGPKG
jgi:membrane protein DedA with SNARE-associated domain